MVTFDDLKKANDSISTLTLERKDKKTGAVKQSEYATVAQRIKAFRMVYPTGYIITDLVSNENGVCIYRAEVGYTEYTELIDGTMDKTNRTLATGTAREQEGSSFINSGSHIENCETSAVGRALGFAGFGIDTDVASADEVQNAELNNIQNEKIDDLKVSSLTERCRKSNVNVEDLCKLYKVKSLADLTMRKFMNIHDNWDKIALGNGEAGY